jgi:hypothetical protein
VPGYFLGLGVQMWPHRWPQNTAGAGSNPKN